jgi:hypothetical protein
VNDINIFSKLTSLVIKLNSRAPKYYEAKSLTSVVKCLKSQLQTANLIAFLEWFRDKHVDEKTAEWGGGGELHSFYTVICMVVGLQISRLSHRLLSAIKRSGRWETWPEGDKLYSVLRISDFTTRPQESNTLRLQYKKLLQFRLPPPASYSAKFSTLQRRGPKSSGPRSWTAASADNRGTEELPQAREVQTVTSSILLRPNFVQFVLLYMKADTLQLAWNLCKKFSSHFLSFRPAILFIFLAFSPCPTFSFLLCFFLLIPASFHQSFRETKLNEFFLCNQLSGSTCTWGPSTFTISYYQNDI